MHYRDNIRPWSIFACLISGHNVCVARFRKRSDADAYARILRQLSPDRNFQVVFDRQEITQG